MPTVVQKMQVDGSPGKAGAGRRAAEHLTAQHAQVLAAASDYRTTMAERAHASDQLGVQRDLGVENL
jgi:hypothetical protein